jgi:hypothetical protein
MSSDLRRAVEERRLQYGRFAEWEERERRTNVTGATSLAGQRAITWYSEALDLAMRTGGSGRGAPETHLTDLVKWVQRWRRAWRAA